MIGRLRGTLVEQDDTRVLIECAGVGYEVAVSTNTLVTLPDVGEQVTLRIFTHMMENKLTLYGFGSPLERDLFDLLITVKKVGPASAVGILSAGSGPADIAQMIADGDTGLLTKLRGVGKKTAELLVVELKEKCLQLLAGRPNAGSAKPVAAVVAPRQSDRPPILDDVAAALVQLGWRPQEADKAVAELEVSPDTTLESLLRQALRSMPR